MRSMVLQFKPVLDLIYQWIKKKNAKYGAELRESLGEPKKFSYGHLRNSASLSNEIV